MCAENCVNIRQHLSHLKLFPAIRPLQSVPLDIPGPLPRTGLNKRFIVFIADRFTNLTQTAALGVITARYVATAFCEIWVFKYCPPEALLADSGTQFASKLFLNVCQLLRIINAFTSAYHRQTSGQVERHNRTLLALLRIYVNDHQNDWDTCLTALIKAHNNNIFLSTDTTSFELVLSRFPPLFSLHRSASSRPAPARESKEKFLYRTDGATQSAYGHLIRAQERYKKDFDRRIREVDQNIKVGDYVYIDRIDGRSKPRQLTADTAPNSKLRSPAVGPCRVLSSEKQTFGIHRDGEIKRSIADRVVYAPLPPQMVPSTPTLDDLAAKVHTGPTYTVEKLLQHRPTDNSKAKSFVIWSAYFTPTWEPRTHILVELILRYFARSREQTERHL